MSDLLDDKGQILISPGDLYDKWTILVIKLVQIDSDPEGYIAKEMERLSILLKRVYKLVPDIEGYELSLLISELHEINSEQWHLEDRVRTEESWEAARAARENNNKRVKVKNKINELFGYPTEIKRYKK